MNSEITNVSKLVPATAVKNNRQNEGPTPFKTNVTSEKRIDLESASLLNNLADKEGDKEREVKTHNLASLDTLKSAAAAGNSMLQSVNLNLEFVVDDSTKKVVIKIVDRQTGDIVRQIPSEDMMAFIKKMQELDGEKGSVIQDRA